MGGVCFKAEGAKVRPDDAPTLLTATPVAQSEKQIASSPEKIPNPTTAQEPLGQPSGQPSGQQPSASSTTANAQSNAQSNTPEPKQEESKESDKASDGPAVVPFVLSVQACASVKAYDAKNFGSGMKELHIVPDGDSGTSDESDVDSLQASIQVSLRMADEAVSRAEREKAEKSHNTNVLKQAAANSPTEDAVSKAILLQLYEEIGKKFN